MRSPFGRADRELLSRPFRGTGRLPICHSTAEFNPFVDDSGEFDPYEFSPPVPGEEEGAALCAGALKVMEGGWPLRLRKAVAEGRVRFVDPPPGFGGRSDFRTWLAAKIDQRARRGERLTVAYSLTGVEGSPPYRFTCSVTIDGEEAGVGIGDSEKEAEKRAARDALIRWGDRRGGGERPWRGPDHSRV